MILGDGSGERGAGRGTWEWTGWISWTPWTPWTLWTPWTPWIPWIPWTEWAGEGLDVGAGVGGVGWGRTGAWRFPW